ncbi:(S)-ureidoglycine aminohydrolase [Epibacterium sp. SM1979]|uniref:(S)-ureidoglycine aminohydrolase n=1 Tax=Tritonibacter litoralis TaxID=2662264 RepID=A0A843YJF3_9RHOB|nr:bifunctional allantoicase/(S)-ureidoglycine aminohydrolase [Tritonibacter litoralis]MQQ09289.1 (S)-ureidoglycine aminohydrolase [Tritonibacter litoralis]
MAGRPPYFTPSGGLPDQHQLLTGRAVFTDAYAVIPRDTMRDIVTSFLPGWTGMRMWVLARPLSGFAETFSQYIVELQPGGGAATPETDANAQGALFVTQGRLSVTIEGTAHQLGEGGFAYVPAGATWSVANDDAQDLCAFHWIRKEWKGAPGVTPPAAFVAHEQDIAPTPMPDTNGSWATTRFMDPTDMAHDMHVTVVTFEPGGIIPFAETHVMEHGLYVLEGKAVYRLNQDWVEVEAGDFMWLRAFCPQACYAGGPGRFRYLLYKDVNRHMPLAPLR